MTFQPKSVYDLPELPTEALGPAGVLARSVEEPVVTFFPTGAPKPDRPEPQPDPRAQPHCGPSASTTNRKFNISFLYPKVMCYPNNAPEHDVLFANFRNGGDAGPERPIAPSKAFFKLSRLDGADLRDPMFCTIVYGPWIADIIETGSCSQGCTKLPSGWQMTCPPLPEIFLNWYGTWDDAPLGFYPTLQLLQSEPLLVSEATVCCPGFSKNKDGWCVPDSINDPFDGLR